MTIENNISLSGMGSLYCGALACKAIYSAEAKAALARIGDAIVNGTANVAWVLDPAAGWIVRAAQSTCDEARRFMADDRVLVCIAEHFTTG